MIAPHFESSEAIVQGKGQIADETTGIIVIALGTGDKVTEVPDERNPGDVRRIIKLERTLQSVAVCQAPYDYYKYDLNNRRLQKPPVVRTARPFRMQFTTLRFPCGFSFLP
jgi:hypothetical protein